MSADRIDKLREARDKPPVSLQRYNSLRSKDSGKLICAFEGYDDVTFYDAMFNKINAGIQYSPLVCNGKDKVLALREILARNVAADGSPVRFFVDTDFDGLKGKPPGPDIYLTPCYSIENLLVGKHTLEKLLRGEFRCHDEHSDLDIEDISNLFQLRLTEFNACMYDANHLLFFARKSTLQLKSIDEKFTTKFLDINLKQIKVAGSHTEWALLGYTNPPDTSQVAACKPAFDLLDRTKDWRGKFLFAFFKKFLSLLKEDRGGKEPVYFKGRVNMSFAPDGDIIRMLTAMIPVPDCLRAFISNFPAPGIS
jgi:hypothetical protein